MNVTIDRYIKFYRENNPFSPRGRLGRLDFLFWSWGFPILLLTPLGISAWIVLMFGSDSQFLIAQQMIAMVVVIVSPITLWIVLMSYIKRIHDLNTSGWWLLLCVIPIINLIAFLIFLSTPGTNHQNNYWLSYQTPIWEKKALLLFAFIAMMISVFLTSICYYSYQWYYGDMAQYERT